MKLYENVAQRTSSLHHACEQLLSDQTNLSSSADEVHKKLSYFQNVESVMHKLSSPMLNVTNENFIHVLNIIDEALAFLKAHPDYRDSSDYC